VVQVCREYGQSCKINLISPYFSLSENGAEVIMSELLHVLLLCHNEITTSKRGDPLPALPVPRRCVENPMLDRA
jgi:hypothetical protein